MINLIDYSKKDFSIYNWLYTGRKKKQAHIEKEREGKREL